MSTPYPNYKILEFLAAGGMGEVYLAKDLRLPRLVAIKTIHPGSRPDAAAELVTEARIAAALNHPNICTIFEVAESADGTPFIAMEYLPEAKTSDRTYRGEQLFEIGIQIADALAEAHAHDIIHRDIKPSNVVVTSRGHVKVLDFGLAATGRAHALTLTESAEDVSASSRGAGTLAFMSPEQVQQRPLDHRSDIFSLGATLYVYATGSLPFSGDTRRDLIQSICEDEPLPPSALNRSLPRSFDLILETAMDKDPERRFPSCSAMRTALEVALRQQRSHPPVYLEDAGRIADRQEGRREGLSEGHISDRPEDRPAEHSQDSPGHSHERPPARRAERARLAVLPIQLEDPSDHHRSLCDGLLETLCEQLSHPRSKVAEKFCILPLADVRKRGVVHADEAEQELGANLVLSSQLQEVESGSFEITVALLQVPGGRTLRSKVVRAESIDQEAQEELHTCINLLLRVDVDLEDHTRSMGQTESSSAYVQYLTASGQLQRYEDPVSLDSAIEGLESVVSLDPTFALAHSRLGEAYWRLYGETHSLRWAELAQQHCRRAIEMERNLPVIHMTLGLVARGLGRVDEALKALKQAHAMDPDSAAVHVALAKAQEDKGDFGSAEKSLTRAIEIAPEYWGSRNALGAFFYRRNRPLEAAVQFYEVIRLIPNSAWGYGNLGSLFFAMQRYSDAESMLQTAFEKREEYAAACNLGTFYWGQAAYDKAVRWYSTALEYNDRDHRIWGYRGRSRALLGWGGKGWMLDFEQAIELAEAELSVNPRDVQLQVHLSSHLAQIGENERARKWVKALENEEFHGADVFVILADTCETLGDRASAVRNVRAAPGSGFPEFSLRMDPAMLPVLDGLGVN